MADRTRFLLAYDISHPRRLRRVHRVATTFGYPLQYSLFICDVDDVQFVDLVDALRSEINEREDRVSLFNLGPPLGRGRVGAVHLGRAREVPPTDQELVW